MFYIAYKSDGTTACKKQISLSRLTEVGKTKSGVTLYCTPSTENDGAPYRWFYTVEGIPDLLDRANISPYAEPEQIRTILDGMSESQAAQVFPDAAAKLEQIKLAIVNKGWTSNADALFCEICGDFATANAVRLNRAEYRARQNEEEEKKAAAEQERIAKQNAEEKLAEKQLLDKAETDLKAGKFISPAMFEKLADRYGIPLPAKFLGWLRQWCGNISITRHTEELPHGVASLKRYTTKDYDYIFVQDWGNRTSDCGYKYTVTKGPYPHCAFHTKKELNEYLSLYEAVEEPYFDNDNLRKKYWILKSAFVSVWTENAFGKINADKIAKSLFNGRYVPTKYIKDGTTLLRYVLRADENRP